MNEEKDKKPEGHEQDFSELSGNRWQPPPKETGGSFMRGCGIALGVVVLVFFFIVGACFLSV